VHAGCHTLLSNVPLPNGRYCNILLDVRLACGAARATAWKRRVILDDCASTVSRTKHRRRRAGSRVRGTGALVVGGDYQGLGIVRSLGRNGIPVCVIDDERSIARFSRHATRAVRVPDLRDEARCIDALVEVGHRLDLDRWVLYPTRDETVTAIARHRSLLAERFRVPTPDWETVKWAADKRNTHRLARELGIPSPRTWLPKSVEDLSEIEIDGAVAIKPAIKERFIYATKAKAWRADTKAALSDRFQQAAEIVGPGEVMVQELIPGDGRHQFAYCAFFKAGESIGSMVARRRRQHPPEFGRASTFVETVDVPLVESLSERFLRAIDYYGLVELEYKLDPRDGEYKLLDVNARTWGYHSLGPRAGVDFPHLLFADQLGQRVQRQRARPGVTWIRLVTDVPTAALELLRGHLDWKEYARSLRKADVEAVFSARDILPGIAELGLIPYLYVKRGF
jgi:D-aspartate ligase